MVIIGVVIKVINNPPSKRAMAGIPHMYLSGANSLI
jgi:hypothetical protein